MAKLIIIYVLHAGLFALGLYLFETSRSRANPALCLGCNYNLQGLPKDRAHCPECGDRLDLQPRGDVLRVHPFRMILAMIAMGIAVVGCCSGITWRVLSDLGL
jgi:hypothetical protein